MLLNGADAVTEAPEERWDIRRYYHPDPLHTGTTYVRRGGYLKNIDQFDAAFFRITAAEAAQMDPQQRLLLETAWEALEDAGQVPSRLAGSATGVFVGLMFNDYEKLANENVAHINGYTGVGGAFSIAANRLSYLFDLRGPSLAVDTACSSSLVAVHLACESLRSGESTLALACGANALINPKAMVALSKASMLSPQGLCRSFDAGADGYVRGEGAAVLVLKPLSRALTDGNPVHGVIRASGVNQDGHSPGLTYPSQAAQEALLRQVYGKASVTPSQVYYIEAHGTGTQAGDPVECGAIGAVFAAERPARHPLRIGSVKSNIGHLESAAGVAGMMKAALILKHRQVPANLHFKNPNPKIPFDDLRLQVQQQLETIPNVVEPLIVGVNSFGFGGTNAHIVLQEYRGDQESGAPERQDETFILPISARHPEALRSLVQAYLKLLEQNDPPSLRDLCFSAARRREHHPLRMAVAARSQAELHDKLQSFGPDASQGVQPAAGNTGPVFVFSGNGPQWWGMGRQLMARSAVFRTAIERCDQALLPLAGWSLREELTRDEAHSRMDSTEIAQPALFAVQIGLAELWASWGIKPSAVVGHSVGEIAAAYVAGILAFDDAIQVVFHRSRLQERTAGQGKMVAVGLAAEAMQELLAPYKTRVSIASINSPQAVTLAGEVDALEEVTGQLLERGIFCRFLKLDYAFHHRTMDAIEQDLLQALHQLHPQSGRIPFISTVTGAEMDGSHCNALYWWRNVREPVQFAAAIRHCINDGWTSFLEVGPHPVLAGYLNECLDERPGLVVSSLRRNEDDVLRLLDGLGALYAGGLDVAWDAVVPEGKFVPLPSYPWQRERHWPAPDRTRWVHPLLGERLALSQPVWQCQLSRFDLAYLRDHQVDDAAMFPGAGYADLMLAAADDLFGSGSHQLMQLEILRPLFLDEDSTVIQTVFSPEDNRIQVLGRAEDGWLVQAAATLAKRPVKPVARVDLDEIRARCLREIGGAEFYAACRRRGYQYGPAFQLAGQILTGNGEALARIMPPAEMSGYRLHPALLDACLHVVFAFVPEDYLPVGIERLRGTAAPLPAAPIYSHVRINRDGERRITLDCRLMDETGQVLLDLTGVRAHSISMGAGRAARELADHCYEEAWFPQPLHPQSGPALPAPAELAANLVPIIKTIDREFAIGQFYERILPCIHSLALGYILNVFRALGWVPQTGDSVTASVLIERLGILPKYQRLIRAWCLILEEEGILSPKHDGAWSVAGWPVLPDLSDLEQVLLTGHPDYQLSARLLLRCGRALTGILTGKEEARDILFGDGDAALLEHSYANCSYIRRDQYIVRAAVDQLIARLPEGQRLRILEVGAGTGATTSHLLPFLPADRTTYCFSDISQIFLDSARQKFRAYPFIEYRLLDLDRDPLAQGFAPQSFDLIVAANALHVARDLRRSLAGIHDLLAPGGMLCLMETTHPLTRCQIFIFGLLEEFWAFEDTGLRSASAWLPVSAWRDVLTESGFADVATLSPRPSRQEPEMTVLLAQKPFAALSQPAEALRQSFSPPTGQRQSAETSMVVFVGNDGLAEQLLGALGASNVVVVHRDKEYRQTARDSFTVRPRCREDLQRLFEDLRQQGAAIDQLIYLWGLNNPSDEPSVQQLGKAVDDSCLSLIYLVQALDQDGTATLRLTVVTSGTPACSGGHSVGDGELAALMQSPLRGVVRVLADEQPDLATRLIALSVPREIAGRCVYAPTEVQALAGEILAPAIEDSEIWLRGAARYVNRIVRAPIRHRTPSDRLVEDPAQSFRLETATDNRLAALLRAVPRPMPGAGEVQIAVAAAALDSEGRATACAGTVAAIGENVTDLRLGDEVIALSDDGVGPYLVADAKRVMRKPVGLTMAAAASIAQPFLIAIHGLRDCAHLGSRDRVLVVGAASGTGLAAIQIARLAGAHIIACAKDSEQRTYLRALGIDHVFDSSSPGLVEDIREASGGEGVDIVFAAATADESAARHLFDVLRPNGRFLDIGLAGGKSSLVPPVQCGFSYISIAVDRLMASDGIARRLRELADDFEKGTYRPLAYEPFELSRAGEALRLLRGATSVGQIVIDLRHHRAPVTLAEQAEPISFRADSSYLVTGGTSGFGVQTALWLVQHGARFVILASRSGIPTEEARHAIAAMQAVGASVRLETVDVSHKEAIAELLDRIRAHCPPLRGIVHAAMVLDDRLIRQLDDETWSKVLMPKMHGAWNLHRATRTLALDFFVLYSSQASLLGNNGQANYVAANWFLDALAHYRSSGGLPALAVRLGMLQDTGALVRQTERSTYIRSYLQSVGALGMDHEPLLDVMGQCIQQRDHHKGIMGANWRVWDATRPGDTPDRRRWASLIEELPREASSAAGDATAVTLADFTPTARFDTVAKLLLEELAQLLRLSPQQIDLQSTLPSLGVDSLMTVHLRSRFKRALNLSIPAMQLLRPQPLTDLIAGIVARIGE